MFIHEKEGKRERKKIVQLNWKKWSASNAWDSSDGRVDTK